MGSEIEKQPLQSPESPTFKKNVFVSYGHADDADFAEKLRTDLEEKGYRIWLDRYALKSNGLGWPRQIADGIDRAEKFIIILGPKASHSKYVQEEYEIAIDTCKTIIPLLRIGEYSDTPKELSHLQIRDFRTTRPYDKAFAELQGDLEIDIPLGKLHGTDKKKPEIYLKRFDTVSSVAKELLEDQKKPQRHYYGTFSIQGLEGSGKSFLAYGVATNSEVRRAFEGGIFWIEAQKETKNFTNELKQILLSLAEKESQEKLEQILPQLTDNILIEKIRQIATETPCLFVIDNIWDAPLVKDIFQKIIGDPSSKSKLLITTRNKIIGEALGKTIDQERYEFKSDESRALLLSHARYDQHLTTPEIENYIEEVLNECGNLPYALKIAGSIVKGYPSRWKLVAGELKNSNFDDLNFQFGDNPNYKLTQISEEELYKRLYPDTSTQKTPYSDLSIFPKDKPIAVGDIKTVFARLGYSETEIETFIALTVDLSLANYGETEETTLLHDIQWDYIYHRTIDTRTKLHSEMLDNYQKDCDGKWWELKDDGYIYENLVRHLIGAGRIEEVKDLLLNPNWVIKKAEKRWSLVADYQIYPPLIDFCERTKNITNEKQLDKFEEADPDLQAIYVIGFTIDRITKVMPPETTPDVLLSELCNYISSGDLSKHTKLDKFLAQIPLYKKTNEIHTGQFLKETEAILPGGSPLTGSAYSSDSVPIVCSKDNLYYMTLSPRGGLTIKKLFEDLHEIKSDDEIQDIKITKGMKDLFIATKSGVLSHRRTYFPKSGKFRSDNTFVVDTRTPIRCLTILEDRNELLFLQDGKAVRYNIDSDWKKPIFYSVDLRYNPDIVAVSKNGVSITTVIGNELIVYNGQTKKQYSISSELFSDITSLAISGDGVAFFGTSRGDIGFWLNPERREEGARVWLTDSQRSKITNMLVAKNKNVGHYVAFTTKEGRLTVFSFEPFWGSATLARGEQGEILSINATDNGNNLITTSSLGYLTIWNLTRNQSLEWGFLTK